MWLMPDLHELLHDAAPKPVAPLDMAALQRRAHRFSKRRLVAWLAGVVAVAGVGLPAGTTLLASANHGERVGVVNTTVPRPVSSSTTSTTGPPTAAPTG